MPPAAPGPAIVILIAAAVAEEGLAQALWARLVGLLVPILATVLAVAVIGAVWFYEGQVAWLTLPCALIGIAAACLAWRRLGDEAVLCCALTGVALYWGVYQGAVPRRSVLQISPLAAG